MLNITCIREKCKFDFLWFWLEDHLEHGGEYFFKLFYTCIRCYILNMNSSIVKPYQIWISCSRFYAWKNIILKKKLRTYGLFHTKLDITLTLFSLLKRKEAKLKIPKFSSNIMFCNCDGFLGGGGLLGPINF